MSSMVISFVLDCHDPRRLAEFWTEAIDYREAAQAGAYTVLAPREGPGPVLALQRVPEAKTVKNRMHMDIRADQLDVAVERLMTLGARRLQAGVLEEVGYRWIVMADPEGNEFCIYTEA
jgi:predicted enzyme related to lactoylglutathione lyase